MQAVQVDNYLLRIGVNISMTPNQISTTYNSLLGIIKKLKKEYNDSNYRKRGAHLDFINKLARVQMNPYFNKENPTMDSELVNSLYTAIILVFNKFNVESDPNKLNYLISCFNRSIVKNVSDIKEFAVNEMNNPTRSDSRFYMQLRSICVVLGDNSEILQEKYMKNLELVLKPLFDNYSDQDYLNQTEFIS